MQRRREPNAVLSVDTAITVPFFDVDSMNIVWHGHYLRYCESAREAYCAARGMSYTQMEYVGSVAPIIRCQLEYLKPAQKSQLLTVRIAHIPDTQPTLNLFYEIIGPTGDLLCIAETVQVFIDLNGVPFLSPPPPVETFFATIEAARRARKA